MLACGQVDTVDGRSAHVKLAIAHEDRRLPRSRPPLLETTYEERCAVSGAGPEPLATAISRCVEAIAAQIAADADAIGLRSEEVSDGGTSG